MGDTRVICNRYRFSLSNALGSGAFGSVYRGEDIVNK